jgi:hypothetical protein
MPFVYAGYTVGQGVDETCQVLTLPYFKKTLKIRNLSEA